MGYTVLNRLKVYPQKETDRIIQDLKGLVSGQPEDLLHGSRDKWYSCMDDCLRISKRYPDINFSLYQTGEEEGDLTRTDFSGGEIVSSWQFEGIPDAPESFRIND